MSTSTQLERTPAFLNGQVKQLFIGGEWCPAADGAVFDSINPSTGQTIAQLAAGSTADVDRAVAAARAAFEGPWSKFTPVQRQNVLLELADLIVADFENVGLIDVLDMGVPVRVLSSPDYIVEILRYYAGWATKLHGETVENSLPGSVFSYTLREPVGVVAAIIPWNAPLTMAVLKIAGALATGCTLVLKPAEQASLSPLRLAELLRQLDVPPGVVNIVTGFGETAGAALSAHLDVDKITFTGSTVVGQKIVRAAAGNLKRVSLELGGKSPDIVFADANLEAAVEGAGWGVFFNSGQSCCAGTRIFVERPAYEEFVDRLAAYASSLTLGNSLDPATEVGPIVSEGQLARVTTYLKSGKAEGARTATGGSRVVDAPLGDGYFVRPTVFADVRDDMKIAREEIFGPVASVMPFDDMDEVLRRANQTQYGLGGGVWTRDVGKAHKVAGGIRTGMVWVNTYQEMDHAMPFGGTKMSGWGSELSVHSLHEYLNVKAVYVRTDN